MTDEKTPGVLRIRLGALAIAALLVAIAALTTLVIIVAIKQVDLLSVVALALAVIAFSAQLVIYVVQSADSAAGARRTLELHSELSGLLAELRERTGRTQQSVDSINSRLITAMIEKVGAVKGSPEFVAGLAERATEMYSAASREPRGARRVGAARRVLTTSDLVLPALMPSTEARRIHEELDAWPELDEIPEIEAALEELDERPRDSLARLARDLHLSTEPDSAIGPGLWLSDPVLVEKRLIYRMKNTPNLYTLTDEGIRLGRAFTAPLGEAPEEAARLVAMRDEWYGQSSLRLKDSQ